MKSNKNCFNQYCLKLITVHPKKGILARLELIALWKWATHLPIKGNAVIKFGADAQLLYRLRYVNQVCRVETVWGGNS